MDGCGLDSFQCPAPFWSRPLLGIIIQPWLGDQPLFDPGPTPRSPPGAERSVTNQC